jgi:hypothetical protein
MIRRAVVLGTGRTKWYRDLIGTEFDVEVIESNKFSYSLVNNEFNLNNLKEPQHKARLLQDSMGIAIKDCGFIEIKSNAIAKSLLSKEY